MPLTTSAHLVEARSSPIHGMGVFAVAPIRRGCRIIEYTGRREPWADHAFTKKSHTELFHVSPTHIINPISGGSIARYINHACAPNCQALLEEERVFIYALRPIKPGEELFYDYGLVLGRRPTREDILLHRCRCGAPRCRGTLLHVPPSRRAKVRRWVLDAT
ncbi:MAG TPA: SET domain-containing protein-lysine N-methyltransferase [Kiritimatiellia bacterium]|nr:SET domain-containing protein-lysine N-methyltransferase [Kiritimatiellia bacterium]